MNENNELFLGSEEELTLTIEDGIQSDDTLSLDSDDTLTLEDSGDSFGFDIEDDLTLDDEDFLTLEDEDMSFDDMDDLDDSPQVGLSLYTDLTDYVSLLREFLFSLAYAPKSSTKSSSALEFNYTNYKDFMSTNVFSVFCQIMTDISKNPEYKDTDKAFDEVSRRLRMSLGWTPRNYLNEFKSEFNRIHHMTQLSISDDVQGNRIVNFVAEKTKGVEDVFRLNVNLFISVSNWLTSLSSDVEESAFRNLPLSVSNILPSFMERINNLYGSVVINTGNDTVVNAYYVASAIINIIHDATYLSSHGYNVEHLRYVSEAEIIRRGLYSDLSNCQIPDNAFDSQPNDLVGKVNNVLSLIVSLMSSNPQNPNIFLGIVYLLIYCDIAAYTTLSSSRKSSYELICDCFAQYVKMYFTNRTFVTPSTYAQINNTDDGFELVCPHNGNLITCKSDSVLYDVIGTESKIYGIPTMYVDEANSTFIVAPDRLRSAVQHSLLNGRLMATQVQGMVHHYKINSAFIASCGIPVDQRVVRKKKSNITASNSSSLLSSLMEYRQPFELCSENGIDDKDTVQAMFTNIDFNRLCELKIESNTPTKSEPNYMPFLISHVSDNKYPSFDICSYFDLNQPKPSELTILRFNENGVKLASSNLFVQDDSIRFVYYDNHGGTHPIELKKSEITIENGFAIECAKAIPFLNETSDENIPAVDLYAVDNHLPLVSDVIGYNVKFAEYSGYMQTLASELCKQTGYNLSDMLETAKAIIIRDYPHILKFDEFDEVIASKALKLNRPYVLDTLGDNMEINLTKFLQLYNIVFKTSYVFGDDELKRDWVKILQQVDSLEPESLSSLCTYWRSLDISVLALQSFSRCSGDYNCVEVFDALMAIPFCNEFLTTLESVIIIQTILNRTDVSQIIYRFKPAKNFYAEYNPSMSLAYAHDKLNKIKGIKCNLHLTEKFNSSFVSIRIKKAILSEDLIALFIELDELKEHPAGSRIYQVLKSKFECFGDSIETIKKVSMSTVNNQLGTSAVAKIWDEIWSDMIQLLYDANIAEAKSLANAKLFLAYDLFVSLGAHLTCFRPVSNNPMDYLTKFYEYVGSSWIYYSILSDTALSTLLSSESSAVDRFVPLFRENPNNLPAIAGYSGFNNLNVEELLVEI